MVPWYYQTTDLSRPGTSHIAAIDHSGLAISAITTINLLFGSKVMVPETGIIMNNEMDGMLHICSRSPQLLTYLLRLFYS